MGTRWGTDRQSVEIGRLIHNGVNLLTVRLEAISFVENTRRQGWSTGLAASGDGLSGAQEVNKEQVKGIRRDNQKSETASSTSHLTA